MFDTGINIVTYATVAYATAFIARPVLRRRWGLVLSICPVLVFIGLVLSGYGMLRDEPSHYPDAGVSAPVVMSREIQDGHPGYRYASWRPRG